MAMLAYCFCATVVGMAIMPNRATANTMGIALTPFFAVFAAIVGLVLGFIARFIWSMATKKVWTGIHVRVWTTVLLVLAIFASGAAGVRVAEISRFHWNNTSAVLVDVGSFQYVPVPSPLPNCNRSATLIAPSKPSATVRWGDNETEIVLSDTEFLAKDKTTGRSCNLPYEGLGSIWEIYATRLVVANLDRPVLAMVINDRADRGAIVAVLSPNYEVLYAERVDGSWKGGHDLLGVIKDPDSPGAQLGILGPSGQSPRAFRLNIVNQPVSEPASTATPH